MHGLATSPLPSRGSPTLQSGGQNQKWPTNGRFGYITIAVWGLQHFRAGDKIRSGPQVGSLAASPTPSRGSPTLQSWWENWKWPTNGQIGYIGPAIWGVPNASHRGTKSKVVDKCTDWLDCPCGGGGPQHFKAGNKNHKLPQKCVLATSPLPSRGPPTLQCGEQNETWRTRDRISCITHAI